LKIRYAFPKRTRIKGKMVKEKDLKELKLNQIKREPF